MSRTVLFYVKYDNFMSPATHCIICQKPIIHLAENQRLYRERGLIFSRIAHVHCRKLIMFLKAGKKKNFNQHCIKYEISSTEKALYLSLVKENQ